MKAVEEYIARQNEDVQGVFLAMQDVILSQDKAITQAWKYGMPFFCYKGRMFCYLWTRKITGEPYIGFVEGKHLDHPLLLQEKRSRMKILLLDTRKDLPVILITTLLQRAIALYTTGEIKLK